jgi:two-component system KDP operon response regulator KdpE
VEVPPDLPALWLDFVLIEHVLVNLLENAAKYSPPGTTIQVKAYRRDRTVAVEVRGEGIGVPPADLERIFDKFYRVQRGDRQGAGMGAHGYHVIEASGGKDAIVLTTTERPGVLMLDLGLPDMDGLEVIRHIREWSNVPIIVLSVRGREADKIAALDSGADDYVTKPFGMGELLARIRAALRHRLQAEAEEPVLRSGGLMVDLAKRVVTVDGQEVKLTPREYDLLRVLITHAGKVMTHQQLLREVWGPASVYETHYLRVYIGQLRQKIERDPAQPAYLLTEPGVGYRLRLLEEN